MKDYSMTLEEQENFILRYEKDRNEIAIYFANGDCYKIPNTSYNESKVLEKMNDQVSGENIENFIRERKISNTVRVGVSCVAGFAAVFLINVVGGDSAYVLGMPEGLAMAAGAATTISAFIPGIVKNNRLIKDAEKNRFFVEYKEDICAGLTNNNVLKNSNDRGREIPEELTINTADDLTMEQLQEAVNYFNHEQQFKFDTFEEEVISKPKTRKRTR